MDAERLLRRYLEQRRELGERDLVLDDMSVEEVLRLLGAKAAARERPAAAKPPAPSSRVAERESPPRSVQNAPPPHTEAPPSEHGADWRSALRAAGAGHEPPRRVDEPPPNRRHAFDPPLGSAPTRGGTEALEPVPPITVVPGDQADPFAMELRRIDSISGIAAAIAGCRRCSLYATAKNPVPGEGSPSARFMCVGEAPGATEDELGLPFMGQAGQLLTKMLAAIKLGREEVFIANVLKHRPPGNRNPLPEEVQACRPYLLRQIELVQPRVILALGTFAAQSLLETRFSISRLRSTVHSFAGIPVVVTYHPAALLRNSNWKRPAWEDVQLARRIFDSTNT